VADDAELGPQQASALGAGSGRPQSATISVLAPTTTTLELAKGSLVAGGSLTFEATVSGAATDGTVTFTDGPPASGSTGSMAPTAVSGGILGSAEVVDGVATFTLSEGLTAGDHSIVASFARTDVASASSSAALALVIAAAPVDGGSPIGGGGGGSGSSGSGTPDSPVSGSPVEGFLAFTGGEGFGWTLLAALGLLGTGGTLFVLHRRRRASV
jgi:alkaline phosphatase